MLGLGLVIPLFLDQIFYFLFIFPSSRPFAFSLSSVLLSPFPSHLLSFLISLHIHSSSLSFYVFSLFQYLITSSLLPLLCSFFSLFSSLLSSPYPHRMFRTHVISLPGLSGSFSPSRGEPTKGYSIVAYLKSYSPCASQPWLFWTLNYCLTPSHLHPEHYITVSQTLLPSPLSLRTHMTSYWCVCTCMYVCGGMCLYICVYVCAQTSVFVPLTLYVHLWQVPSWLLLCLQTCLGVEVNPDGGCAQIPWVFWN